MPYVQHTLALRRNVLVPTRLRFTRRLWRYFRSLNIITLMASSLCSRNIEMTPLCKIEVTLPLFLGSREMRHGGGVDEQAGVQSP